MTPTPLPKPQQPTDDDLRKLIEAAGGDLQSLAIRMTHVRRRDFAAAQKANQPKISIVGEPADLAKLVAEYRKPITEDESKTWANGADMDLVSFQDFLDAGDLADAVCAAFRIARRFHFAVFGPTNLSPDPAKWDDKAKKQFGYREGK